MSDKPNEGGFAFPAHFMANVNGKQSMIWHGGMSLRDWFAGQALAGMLSILDQRIWKSDSGEAFKDWQKRMFMEDAVNAYVAADAMLAARKVVRNEDQ